MLISEIIVGERHRKDYGDVGGLAASLKEHGLLHPVVVRPDKTLIAGERRIKAALTLGWTDIPATVVDLREVVKGERDENFARKDFTPSEAVSIKRALEPVVEEIKAEAKERQRQGGRLKSEALVQLPKASLRVAEKVAAFTGMERRSLAKAEAVVTAAEAEPDNLRIQKIKSDMDRTGNVNGPFKRLKVLKQSEEIRAEPPPLPSKGPYRVIVADPPWPYELRKEDPSHRATHPYPQMSLAQICAIEISPLAHEDCILWLWVTNHHMREAFTVLDAWGFKEKTILTWVKDRFGTGDWLRGQTEHVIMAVRGKPTVELTNQSTALHGPLRANSQKPDEFYTFVESLCPAPRYAYLFSRDSRDNWDMHGDETTAEAAE